MGVHDGDFAPEDAQRIGAIARSLETSDFELDQPPADLWADIEAAAGTGSGPAERSNVVAFPRRPFVLAVAGVAAAVLLAIGLIAFDGSGPEPGELVASTDLDLLDTPYDGRVELLETSDGLELKLDVDDLVAEGDGYLELWLIADLETGAMQSLGPIDGNGRYDLPVGLDPEEFSVVDVSFEPLDGDPTHSGKSALRGELTL